MATWWAKEDREGNEFALKETVIKNFQEEFFKRLDTKHGVKLLEEIDFTGVREYLEKKTEEKKARPKEEKAKELEESKKFNAKF